MAVVITRNTRLTVIDDQIVHRLLAAVVKSISAVPVFMPTQQVIDETDVYARVRATEMVTDRHERLQTGEDRMPVRIVIHVNHTQVGGDSVDRGAARLFAAAAAIRRELTGLAAEETRTISAEQSSTGQAYESTHQLELHRAASRDVLSERFEAQGVVELEIVGMVKRFHGRDMIEAEAE